MSTSQPIALLLWCQSCNSETEIPASIDVRRALAHCSAPLDRTLQVDATVMEITGICASCR